MSGAVHDPVERALLRFNAHVLGVTAGLPHEGLSQSVEVGLGISTALQNSLPGDLGAVDNDSERLATGV